MENGADTHAEVYEGDSEEGWRAYLKAWRDKGWQLQSATKVERVTKHLVRVDVVFKRKTLEPALYSL